MGEPFLSFPSYPPMTVQELFRDIQASLLAIRNELTHEELYQKSDLTKALGTLFGHIDMLVFQAERPYEKRNLSIVRSSWETVLKLGRPLGIFAKYESDKELRQELLLFIREGR